MIKSLSIISTLDVSTSPLLPRSCPFVNVDKQKISVNGLDSFPARTIFVFNKKTSHLVLYIVDVLEYDKFIEILLQKCTNCLLGTPQNNQINLCRKSPSSFYVRGHVEVVVKRPQAENCYVKSSGGSLTRVYLSGGSNATCSVRGGSVLSMCGNINSLSIDALSGDSAIDLRDLRSLTSGECSFTFTEEQVNKENIVLPLLGLPQGEETSRERDVRLNITLPSFEDPELEKAAQNTTFECPICCDTKRGRPVTFIPCGCKRVCLDCTKHMKEMDRSQFLCPYDRVPINKIT